MGMEDEVPFNDCICRLLHDRIVELFRFGFQKIWFKVSKSEDCHLANILGYSNAYFGDMLSSSCLTNLKRATMGGEVVRYVASRC